MTDDLCPKCGMTLTIGVGNVADGLDFGQNLYTYCPSCGWEEGSG